MKGESVLVALFLLIMVIAPIALAVHFVIIGLPSGAYDVNKAKGAIARALTTTDLNDQNQYLEKALDYLRDYSGNPKWWYPTIATDYSVIKNNIQICIQRNSEVSHLNATDYTYQRLVENNLRTYPEIRTALSIAISWQITTTAFNIIVILSYIIAWIVAIIVVIWKEW